MRRHDDHLAFQHQGSFGLDGLQQDIFDVDDALDGSRAPTAGEPFVANSPGVADSLFRFDTLPTPTLERNPGTRVLDAPELADLLQLDAQSWSGGSSSDLAEVEVRVRLDAAGHALLLAASVEREIRRCERVAQQVAASPCGPADVDNTFVRRLRDTPLPWGIKDDGLRLVGAAITKGGALSIRMAQPRREYLCLARWPRVVVSLAVAAVTDRWLRVIDASGWEREIELPATRMKAIAGGVPRAAVEVGLRGGPVDVTAWS